MIYIFSDVHLLSERNPWEIVFLNTLEACLNDPTTTQIVFLGDILDTCTGGPHAWGKVYQRFFSLLGNTTVPILYCEGNHDFNLRLSTELGHIRTFDRALEATWGQKRVYLSHGDWINDQDRSYQALRRIMRSQPGKYILNTLPLPILLPILRTCSRYSRSKHIHTLPTPSHTDQTLFRRFAQQKWKSGFDCVVLGHSHTPEHLESGGRTYLNCGFWPRDLTYFKITPTPWKVQKVLAS